jgi:glycosyltransferase involved in cell wall biosynthesis
MRILHLLGDRRLPRNPEIEGMSGVVRAALELARAQAELGYIVTVAAVGADEWRTSWRTVELRSVAPISWARLRVNTHVLDLRQHLPFVWLTMREPFDVVQGHLYSYLRFLRARIRAVHIHSDPMYTGSRQEGIDLKEADFQCIARYSDVQVAVSRFVARELVQGMGNRGRVHMVYNGVDHDRFDPKQWSTAGRALRHSLNVPEHATVVLFAGSMTPEKGIVHLARAFTRIAADRPDVHLMLAGTNALWGGAADILGYHDAYEQMVRVTLSELEQEGRVHYLGSIPAATMPASYALADVVVVPSTWREAFGLVAAEAMASARPVIASRVGGLPEVLGEQGGVLVPPGDEDALADAIRAMVDNPADRREFGAMAREQALRFSWRETARQLDAIYHDILTWRTI